MGEVSNNKKIAKNTTILYFRMMFLMGVSLFTSRVILDKLGIDDYGIYTAVGGIVGFLSFLNGSLSGGTSRFLTFALGEKSLEKQKAVFSTTLTVHLFLAFAIIIVAETAGLWFLYNKMVIPAVRLQAATWVYHLSIITAFLSLTQTPYNASIIAHERMGVYAYTSIAEATLKLLICYLISMSPFDRLIVYAILLCALQVGMMCFYRFYCTRKFRECHYNIHLYNKRLFKEIFSFSSWGLLASSSIALNSQGILVLLNMFFSPAIVAARSVSLTLNAAITSFVSNFRTAVNPQIIKRYAAKDYEGSKSLLLSSVKYSFFLMWALSLPVYLLAEPLLSVWLKKVPDFSVIFLQLVVFQSLFQVFDTGFYTALYAKGQLRENALISPTLGFIQFPIVYLLFKFGCSPVALSWASLIMYAIMGLLIKPVLLIKIVGYDWGAIRNVFLSCILVSSTSAILPLGISYLVDPNTTSGFFIILTTSIVSIGLSVWILGLDPATRIKTVSYLQSRMKK